MAQTQASQWLATLPEQAEYDVVVLGTGAAGMAAALFASIAGSKVLLVERTEYVGGTTAWSGGTTWVPLTRYLADTPTEDSFEQVMSFLDAAVGEHAPRAMREAFLKDGANAIHSLVDHTQVAFRACAYHPDYLADLPGATVNGRALEPLPYQAGHLGVNLQLLRPPIPEFTVLGGMMVNREDISHLLQRFKKPKSFLYTLKLVGRYYRDKLFYGQTARSVMGHALIARMLASVLERQIELTVSTQVTDLKINTEGSVQLSLQQAGISKQVQAKGGVILATGGFGRDPDKRKAYYPAGVPDFSSTAPGHTGELHKQVLSLGASYGQAEDQPAFWAPVSIRRRADASLAVFPHFVFDRSKPGTICVDQTGQRFVNESCSYHEFAKQMLAGGARTNPAWIICDAPAIQKYGLGMVRLGGDKLSPYLADGYLLTAASLDELAQKLLVSAENLKAAIAQMNEAAESGVDHLFQRGSTVYQRANGDPSHQPNPSLGLIKTPPFYALKLYPADIGTAKGLQADTSARLIREDGSVIEGLYACGNDLNSIMGGTYPGPGITIGPAIVFGYIAAQAASHRANAQLQQRRDQDLDQTKDQ